MPITVSRRNGLGITIALAAVAAIVVGFVLIQSGSARGVDLTTANLVPEDAGVYFALNTDLASSQWVAAFKLIEKLGQEDPEDELKNGLEDLGGLDWEDDIAPLLGGNAAIYLKSFDFADLDVKGAVILKCKDSEAALKVLRRQLPLDLTKEKRGSVEYYAADGGTGFLARLGEHIVITADEESLFDVMDVASGKKKPLTEVEGFRKLRDELTNNFLFFAYVSPENFIGKAFLDDEQFQEILESAGAADIVFQPVALAFGAKAKGFEFHAASLGEAGSISPFVKARDSKLAAVMPGEAAVFFSIASISQTWKDTITKARPQIDDAIASEGEFRNLEDALQDAGRQVGLRSIEEIIELFSGETVLGIWFPTKDENQPEVVLIAEVADVKKAEDVLAKVVAATPNSKPGTTDISGTKVTTVKGDDGDSVSYAFRDGNLLLGTPAGVKAAIERKNGSIADAQGYKDARAQIETKFGTFAYFDLALLLRLAAGGIPAQLDKAEKALESGIFNLVEQSGIVRFTGFILVDD
jgi:hypothetical protein